MGWGAEGGAQSVPRPGVCARRRKGREEWRLELGMAFRPGTNKEPGCPTVGCWLLGLGEAKGSCLDTDQL